MQTLENISFSSFTASWSRDAKKTPPTILWYRLGGQVDYQVLRKVAVAASGIPAVLFGRSGIKDCHWL